MPIISVVRWPNFQEAYKLLRHFLHRRETEQGAVVTVWSDNNHAVWLEVDHPAFQAKFGLDEFHFREVRGRASLSCCGDPADCLHSSTCRSRPTAND